MKENILGLKVFNQRLKILWIHSCRAILSLGATLILLIHVMQSGELLSGGNPE